MEVEGWDEEGGLVEEKEVKDLNFTIWGPDRLISLALVADCVILFRIGDLARDGVVMVPYGWSGLVVDVVVVWPGVVVVGFDVVESSPSPRRV